MSYFPFPNSTYVSISCFDFLHVDILGVFLLQLSGNSRERIVKTKGERNLQEKEVAMDLQTN